MIEIKRSSVFDRRVYLLITFLLAFVPRLILCFYVYPVRTLSDEVATISGAAYFAGYDWSAVVSNAGYYGTGYTSLLAPLFWILKDPIWIYRVMCIVGTILQAATSVIAYYILMHYFKIKNQFFNCIAAVTCSYLVVTRAAIVYNEQAIVFFVWVIALLMFKLQENVADYKIKLRYTSLLFITLSYLLLVHKRMIVVWIAVVIMVAAYFWVYKKWIIALPAAAIIGGSGYAISILYEKFIQSRVWVANGETLRNASIGLNENSIRLLFDLKTWQTWFNIVIGQIGTINIITGGCVTIFLIAFIILIYKKICKKSGGRENQEKIRKMIFPIVFLFMLCVIITIMGQSLTWLANAKDAMAEGYDTAGYGVKAFTYVRYFGPFCGPLLLCGVGWLYYEKEWFGSIYKSVIIVFMILGAYWVVCILPYLMHTVSGAQEAFLSFSLKDGYSEVRLVTYLPGILLCVVSFCIWVICIRHRKIMIPLGILCISLIYQYCYNAVNWDILNQKGNHESVESAYQLVRTMNDQIPHEIYVYDNRGMEDHQIYYEYQVLLYEYQIIPKLPSEEVEEAVAFLTVYNEDAISLIDEGYLCTQLKDRQYLFVKGKSLQEKFENAGISLNDYQPYYEKWDVENTIIENGDWSDAVELERGTYKLSANIETSKKEATLEDVVFEVMGDGSECVAKTDITDKGKLELSFSIEDTPQSIVWRIQGNQEIEVDKIECVKISDEYTVGLAYYEEVTDLYSVIEELDVEVPLVFMETDGRNTVLSELEQRFEAREILKKNKNELRDSNEQYVLATANTDEWMDILSQYTILKKWKHFLLLAETGSSIEQNWQEEKLSVGIQADMSLFYSFDGEKIMNSIYSKISPGNYELVLQTDENIAGEDIYVQITGVNKKDISVNLAEGQIIVSFLARHGITDWSINVYKSDGKYVETRAVSLGRVEDASLYELNGLFGNMLDIRTMFPNITETSVYLYENEFEKSMIQVFLSNSGIDHFNINKYNVRNEEVPEIQGECVILPQNTATIFTYLDDYIIVGKSGTYLLMVKTTEENLKIINENRIPTYSEGEKLKREYFNYEVNEESISEKISLSKGTYQVNILINLNENADSGNIGTVYVNSDERLLNEFEVEVTEEDRDNGYLEKSVRIASFSYMSNLSLLGLSEDNSFSATISGFKKISDHYSLDLEEANLENARYDSNSIVAEKEKTATIASKEMGLEAGEYQFIYTYITDNNSDNSFKIMDGNNIERESTGENSEKIDKNKYEITIVYTPINYHESISAYISKGEDCELKIESIEIIKVQ